MTAARTSGLERCYALYRGDNNNVNCPQRLCPDTPGDPFGLSLPVPSSTSAGAPPRDFTLRTTANLLGRSYFFICAAEGRGSLSAERGRRGRRGVPQFRD